MNLIPNTFTPDLEGVSTEIKLAILSHVQDVASLSALVHASPLYHAAYLKDRAGFLTAAKLRDLSLDDADLLKQSIYVEISCRSVKGAIIIINYENAIYKGKPRPQLVMEQVTELLAVEHVVIGWIDEEASALCCVPIHKNSYEANGKELPRWHYGHGWHNQSFNISRGLDSVWLRVEVGPALDGSRDDTAIDWSGWS